MKFSRKTKIILSIFILLIIIALTVFYAFPKNPWVSRSNNLITKYAEKLNSYWYGMSDKVQFTTSKLRGIEIKNPTSLQFGPDGKLYVSEQSGRIYRLTISRDSANNYRVIAADTIDLVKKITNYNDDGTPDTLLNARMVLGITVGGSSASPVIYVSSSDPRIGGAVSEYVIYGDGDINLDTNSGTISMLTFNGGVWDKTDLVRGLPRSEENHAVNGLTIDESGQCLYVTIGGNTNAGSPSVNMGKNSEYALSAAVLKIDLKQILSMPVKGEGSVKFIYDLPTVDDPKRQNNPDGTDINDPFGGDDGLNQAKIIPGGPVQVFAPGYRNAYDVVFTKTAGQEGRIYTIDNGANPGWGGYPENEGTASVTNNYIPGEPGSRGAGQNDASLNNFDNLHLVYMPGMEKTIYGGHPNPIRANPDSAGLFWKDKTDHFEKKPTADWPPVPKNMADPVEGDFLNPGVDDGALTLFYASTNGLTEYTAKSYFNGNMAGDLVTVSFDGNVSRIKLNKTGKGVMFKNPIAKNLGVIPLDVTANGDDQVFPGSVWVADYQGNTIYIMEPATSPNWAIATSSNKSSPEARHETGFVEAGGKFYLIGGRGTRQVNVYDPATKQWSSTTPLPGNIELNHFQAVTLDNKIYLVGAFTGQFPLEKSVPDIYVFDPQTSQWTVKKNIVPANRLRGSMAAAVFNNKIYITGGSTNGHTNGWVNWTDVYDPSNDSWKALADAPHARDHFQAALLNGKIYAVGGRRTNFAEEKLFNDTESAVDVYDIASDKWQTLPKNANLITPRGGAATVVCDNKIYLIGGESRQPEAHNEVEVFDLLTMKWTSLPPLNNGRHGTQGIVYNNKIYVATGCARQGGSPELNTMEIYTPKN